jgi:uncharacterized damage-inducible protein DinB
VSAHGQPLAWRVGCSAGRDTLGKDGIMVEKITELYRYNAWANARVLDAVEPLGAAELTRDLGGSFPSIHGTLVHMLWVESLFTRRCPGLTTADVAPLPGTSTVADMRRAWHAMDAERRAFLDGVRPADLDAPIRYQDSKGFPVEVPLWQGIFQGVNHSTFHRAQVVTKLRQLGREPPQTDFILYCRGTERRASTQL